MSRSLYFGRRERSTGRGSPVVQANLGSAVSLGCSQCVFPPSSGCQSPSGLDHRLTLSTGWLHIGLSLFDRVCSTKKVREERDEAKLTHLRVFTAFPLPFLSALNNFVCSSSVFSLTSSLPQRLEFSRGNL